jgi:hypothetical protein
VINNHTFTPLAFSARRRPYDGFLRRGILAVTKMLRIIDAMHLYF